ncbi:hypothetical protein ACOME3_001926 [Neoechinorhynchus agilis]
MSNDDRLQKIKSKLRFVQDFPRPGVRFVDIFPVFLEPETCQDLMNICVEHIENTIGLPNVDYIVGVELRGCLFGVPLGLQMRKPFVPVRKKGKLPGKVVEERYGTEYSKDVMEMQVGCMKPGSNVIIIDDLLATGGTMVASQKLIEKLGCNVLECMFIIELLELNGRMKLGSSRIHSIFKI